MSFASMLNKTCTLEVCARNKNAKTGEVTCEWRVLAARVKCRLRTRSYAEKINSEARFQHSSYALYLEYTDINPALTRVVIDGKIYKVTGAVDMGGGEEYLCLYLERWD